jgi:hypothetical protein
VQQAAEVAVHRRKDKPSSVTVDELRQLALDFKEEITLFLGAQSD